MFYGNIIVILLILEKILQESQSTGMLKILLTVSVRLTNTSDKPQLPVIFVARDMRNLPEARRKPEYQTPESSTGNSLVVDIERLSTDDRYVHSFKVVTYRKQAEMVMADAFGLRMSNVDLLYLKEKQLIIIMDKLNISTLNCEGLRRSKDYIRTYLDNNSCDILALQETWHLDNNRNRVNVIP